MEIVCGPERLAEEQIAERSATLAGWLQRQGAGVERPVAFRLPAGPDVVALYRACWLIGATAVALHPRAGRRQVSAALDQLDAPVFVTDPVEPDHGAPGDAVAVSDDAAAVVLFTAGSAGPPKGVVHTHAALRYKVEQLADIHGLTARDAVLMPAPLAHVSGLLHGVLLPLHLGTRSVLLPRWDAGEAGDLIERERVTYMVGPPTLFIELMDHPRFRAGAMTSLRLLSCGGAGVTPAFVERAAATLGCVVKRSYGSTEAPTITTSRHDDPQERMVTTDGRAFGAAELRIDAQGELWVRGPELARGYLDPAQTAAAFVDGWFRTGDAGSIDDGWLTVTGRLDDRIIRAGENIAAAEVEQLLEAHPAVTQAVVVGEPDERLGERVAAFVTAPAGFDLATCRAWFAEEGATPFTTPERLEIVDTIPILASGKPDRAALRARL